MIIASNGERVVAASMLPMPTTAKAATGKSSPAPNCCSGQGKRRPQSGPQEQRRREHPAHRARADRRQRRDQLCQDQPRQE